MNYDDEVAAAKANDGKNYGDLVPVEPPPVTGYTKDAPGMTKEQALATIARFDSGGCTSDEVIAARAFLDACKD